MDARLLPYLLLVALALPAAVLGLGTAEVRRRGNLVKIRGGERQKLQ